MVISAADDKITEIQKIHQTYLLQFLSYLSYEVDNAYAMDAQYKFEENQRKLKRH